MSRTDIPRFTERIHYGKSVITGSGRITSPYPTLDKKGKIRRYAIEEWLLYEARIEASGNTTATLALAGMHAHRMKDQDYDIPHQILCNGCIPDDFHELQHRAVDAGEG